MQRNSTTITPESVLFPWNFFERTLANYSIIMRMFRHVEDESDLMSVMPRVFVEETDFDMCELVVRADGNKSFFSLDRNVREVECGDLEQLQGTLFSPIVLHDVFGYGTLYVHPFKRAVHVFGYLVLGKKKAVELDRNATRELDLLCGILSRFLLFSFQVNELRIFEDAKKRHLDSKLATTRTLLENIIDQFPHPFLLVDTLGTILFANSKGKHEFRERDALLEGEKLEDIVSGIEKDFFEKDLVLQGEIHYRKGDAYRLYNLESYPIKDDQGRLICRSVMLKDVADERVQHDEELYRQKMEMIGRLAGGVAHDFNNVLTGIMGYASLLKRMSPEQDQSYRYAEVIENSAKRAAALTERLLSFSRRQKKDVAGSINLNTLLGDVLFLVKQGFRDIKMEKELDPLLPTIKGDEGELQHVFLNLFVNAKDAMPNGGMLTVKTERKTYIGNREFAVITIKDTGTGIREELKSKVFEPLFTTKTENKKMGMGLYQVQKVMKAHGGFIELESEEGKGTAFVLYLPIVSLITTDVEPKPSPERSFEKRGLLLVDDEPVVRTLLAGILEEQGFVVYKAKDGDEAISLFEVHQKEIDLILLDMLMPGIKGEEVLKRIREMSTSVKVVVSSGYMTEDQANKLKELRVDGLLSKPYRDVDVIRVVNEVLSAAASGSGSKLTHYPAS